MYDTQHKSINFKFRIKHSNFRKSEFSNHKKTFKFMEV